MFEACREPPPTRGSRSARPFRDRIESTGLPSDCLECTWCRLWPEWRLVKGRLPWTNHKRTYFQLVLSFEIFENHRSKNAIRHHQCDEHHMREDAGKHLPWRANTRNASITILRQLLDCGWWHWQGPSWRHCCGWSMVRAESLEPSANVRDADNNSQTQITHCHRNDFRSCFQLDVLTFDVTIAVVSKIHKVFFLSLFFSFQKSNVFFAAVVAPCPRCATHSIRRKRKKNVFRFFTSLVMIHVSLGYHTQSHGHNMRRHVRIDTRNRTPRIWTARRSQRMHTTHQPNVTFSVKFLSFFLLNLKLNISAENAEIWDAKWANHRFNRSITQTEWCACWNSINLFNWLFVRIYDNDLFIYLF